MREVISTGARGISNETHNIRHMSVDGFSSAFINDIKFCIKACLNQEGIAILKVNDEFEVI